MGPADIEQHLQLARTYRCTTYFAKLGDGVVISFSLELPPEPARARNADVDSADDNGRRLAMALRSGGYVP